MDFASKIFTTSYVVLVFITVKGLKANIAASWRGLKRRFSLRLFKSRYQFFNTSRIFSLLPRSSLPSNFLLLLVELKASENFSNSFSNAFGGSFFHPSPILWKILHSSFAYLLEDCNPSVRLPEDPSLILRLSFGGFQSFGKASDHQ